jgi:hypothetical protein
MGNLSANQSAMVNTTKKNRVKQFCGIVHNKDNYLSNKIMHDHKKPKLTILHQNIQGIINKVDEFLIFLSANEPQIICLSEHHLRIGEIGKLNFSQYIVGTSFCRQTYRNGGVCVLVHKNIQFTTINLDRFNKEKDLEIAALKLHFMSNHFIIICMYRSPTGNFYYFLNQLELVLNKVHKISNNLILCGDFNINHFNDNSRKDLLDSLLVSFNLFSTVNFPTRIFNNSCTLIDNIYINTSLHEFSVYPLINGLSDHDAQVITLNNIVISIPEQVYYFRRDISNYSVGQFTSLLSYENWEDVFSETAMNMAFNNFLNTFLRIFYTCFPMVKSLYSNQPKPWLTSGIRTSCTNKRKLYLVYRNSNDPSIKERFKKYCHILDKVIRTAKNIIIINFY